MDRDQLEAEANEIARASRKDIRDRFQARHPHYTPPPDAKPDGAFWRRHAAETAFREEEQKRREEAEGGQTEASGP